MDDIVIFTDGEWSALFSGEEKCGLSRGVLLNEELGSVGGDVDFDAAFLERGIS